MDSGKWIVYGGCRPANFHEKHHIFRLEHNLDGSGAHQDRSGKDQDYLEHHKFCLEHNLDRSGAHQDHSGKDQDYLEHNKFCLECNFWGQRKGVVGRYSAKEWSEGGRITLVAVPWFLVGNQPRERNYEVVCVAEIMAEVVR